MDKPAAQGLKFPARLTVLLLAAVTVFAVLPCLPAGSRVRTAAAGDWRPLLRIYDRSAIALGSDAIGNVYLTEKRMLRKTEQYDENGAEASVRALNSFAQAADVPVFLLAAPTAAGIYADTLPEQAPRADERAMLQHTASVLSGDVTWIEVYSWLAAIRDEYLYFRTDSRWTAFGAYTAYKAAGRKLGYNPVGYDQMVITHKYSSYYGNLAQEIQYGRGAFAPDLIDLYSVENAPALSRISSLTPDGQTELTAYDQPECADQSGNPYDVYALNTEPMLQIETGRTTGKSLLLLSDSYGASFLPLLFPHYRSLTAVNLELAGATDWRGVLADSGMEFQQILVLCSADSLAQGLLAERLSADGH